MWALWKAKNTEVHNNSQPDPLRTIINAKLLETEFRKSLDILIQSSSEMQRRSRFPVKWRPPPTNWIQLNVDTAFSSESNRGAIAVTILDNLGRLIRGSAIKIQEGLVTIAKALAIRKTVILTDNLSMERAIIESDSLILIQIIKSWEDWWEIRPILQDIRGIMAKHQRFGFTWTPRKENSRAHLIAKLKAEEALPGNWCSRPIEQLTTIINADSIQTADHNTTSDL
ncbi:uncharacterized protein LOC107611505 [Arachis ipaensis]|uniref:uncharacterized protein LOC107611505 n=1 Tax=Arachis ipaensis TaxID=130454 RepID=UPI0007AFD2BE|nr:uncharacterized protein LOC107611505 [Arachis ipaensis]XP_025670598.1 uncharacterized protein LOC112770461 [Arachis hypogaea]